MTPEQAEIHALQALGWLTSQEELLPLFMGSTGASANDLRARATEPEFQIAMLDFVMMDDAWVVQMCDALSWPYEQVHVVRQSLPGGAQVHWT